MSARGPLKQRRPEKIYIIYKIYYKREYKNRSARPQGGSLSNSTKGKLSEKIQIRLCVIFEYISYKFIRVTRSLWRMRRFHFHVLCIRFLRFRDIGRVTHMKLILSCDLIARKFCTNISDIISKYFGDFNRRLCSCYSKHYAWYPSLSLWRSDFIIFSSKRELFEFCVPRFHNEEK